MCGCETIIGNMISLLGTTVLRTDIYFFFVFYQPQILNNPSGCDRRLCPSPIYTYMMTPLNSAGFALAILLAVSHVLSRRHCLYSVLHNFWILPCFCIFSQDDPWAFVQAYDKHAPLMVILAFCTLTTCSCHLLHKDSVAAWICGDRDKYWENNWDYVISKIIVIASHMGNMSSLVTDSPPDLQKLTWVFFCGAG